MYRIAPHTLVFLLAAGLAGSTACDNDKSSAPKPESYSASLSGSNETTPPALVIGATGTSTITVNGHELAWTLTTANFASGTTAPGSTSTTLPAHIHLGIPGTAGGIMVPLTATVNGTTSGTVTVVDSVLTHLRAGEAYVNVHTAARAAGEIRGQLVRVQ
ncbi:MAG TPA: CHRD domain-containing protein [Gemmatimonadaceae bacterium]|nr:CHRD domain-containing protein [Gemmatimonadaceae bacterium]